MLNGKRSSKMNWTFSTDYLNVKNTFICVFNVLWFSAPFFNDTSTFSCFTFLFFLQFFGGLFTQQQLVFMEESMLIKCNHWYELIVLTLNFFFLSGVMKPFFAFLALEASSIRLRTSARLRSISACLAFFAFLISKEKSFYVSNTFPWLLWFCWNTII